MSNNSNGMSTGMAALCTFGILLFIGWMIDLGTPKCIKNGCDNDAKEGSNYCYIHDNSSYRYKSSGSSGSGSYSGSTTNKSSSTSSSVKSSESASNSKKTYSSSSSSLKKSYSSTDSYDDGYNDVYEDDDYDYEEERRAGGACQPQHHPDADQIHLHLLHHPDHRGRAVHSGRDFRPGVCSAADRRYRVRRILFRMHHGCSLVCDEEKAGKSRREEGVNGLREIEKINMSPAGMV